MELDSNQKVQNEIAVTQRKIGERVVKIVVITLTIMIALSINSLIQTLLRGLSPAKEFTGFLLIIISQLLYAIIMVIILTLIIVVMASKRANETSTPPKSEENETDR